MAASATFALKYRFTATGKFRWFVWIFRRLQGVEVQSQRVELLVTVSRLRNRAALQLAEVFSGRNEVAVSRKELSVLVQSRITHHVSDGTLNHEAGVIKIATVFQPNQIGNLWWISPARTLPRKNSRWHRFPASNHFVDGT